MRVLFASNYPHLHAITGGLKTATHDLCVATKEMDTEAAVLCGQMSHPDAGLSTRAFAQDEHQGYPVLRTDDFEQVRPLGTTAWSASVVVVQSGTALLPTVRSSLESGKPTAVYLHNAQTHQLAGNLPTHKSLRYLANSTFTAHRWNVLHGLDCAVISHVVAFDRYRAHQIGIKVLCVNLSPVKGVEIMFALAAACPELQLLVMERWSLAPQWRLHCQQRATQLGNVEWCSPAADIRTVYAKSRVLLMPLVWEKSFGRTGIEAQLNGLPVLASTRGPLPQLIGQGREILPWICRRLWRTGRRPRANCTPPPPIRRKLPPMRLKPRWSLRNFSAFWRCTPTANLAS